MSKRLLLAALLLCPSVALAEKTPAKGKPVTYKVDGVEYEGYFSPASKRKAPLVVLLHDWDGLTDYEQKRAEMLRSQGFEVFAADLFGKGVRPTKLEDKQQHTGALYQDRTKLRQLVAAAVETARGKGAGANGVAVIGYCFGGAAVLEYMRSGADAQAFVSIHGGLATPAGQDYKQAKGRLLVQHGAADAHVTLEDFSKLLQELETAKIEHEMIAYGGAPHAWTVFGQDSYREQADEASWERLVDFLKDTL